MSSDKGIKQAIRKFNPYHDPKTGRFASSGSGGTSASPPRLDGPSGPGKFVNAQGKTVSVDSLGGQYWEYRDEAADRFRRGRVERVVDRGGTDVTYFMRDSRTGDLTVMSGDLKNRLYRSPSSFLDPYDDLEEFDRPSPRSRVVRDWD